MQQKLEKGYYLKGPQQTVLGMTDCAGKKEHCGRFQLWLLGRQEMSLTNRAI